MVNKINFDWARFSIIDSELSKTEEMVIKEHFNIWLQGHSDVEYSTPELEDRYYQFRSAWIMSQMFTNH